MEAESASHLQPKLAQSPAWMSYLPSYIRPYFYLAQFHNPAGALLAFYPYTWSVTMACYAHSTPITTLCKNVALFFAAAQAFHVAGCVINDMWDRDLGPRTRTRPLAAGDLSMFQAFVFLTSLLALCIWVLLHLNEYSFRLGLCSLCMTLLYPGMKPATNWSKAVLGLCHNEGVFLGAASIVGKVNWHVYVPLHIGAACWTLMYDTTYACQDRVQDPRYGGKSTSILSGDQIRLILVIFSLASCSFVSYAGIINGHGFSFFIGVAFGALHHARLFSSTDFENNTSCDAALLDNTWFGCWIWAGAMIDYIAKTQV